MAVVHIAHASGSAVGAGSVTYTSTSGNALVLLVSCSAEVGLSDDAGNIWTRHASSLDEGASGQRGVSAWACLDAGAISTLTVTVEGLPWAAIISEWSGAASVADSGALVSNDNTVPALSGGTAVLAGAGFGMSDWTEGEGWTDLGHASTDSTAGSYSISAAAGGEGNPWPGDKFDDVGYAGLVLSDSGGAGLPDKPRSLQWNLRRLSGTSLDSQGAANSWAGTSGLDLLAALNHKNGTTGLGLLAVLNELAGTSKLGVNAAASKIEE